MFGKGVGVRFDVNLIVVPCSGRQPPAFDISRKGVLLLRTSRTARCSGHGCVTACKTTLISPICVAPPCAVTLMLDG